MLCWWPKHARMYVTSVHNDSGHNPWQSCSTHCLIQPTPVKNRPLPPHRPGKDGIGMSHPVRAWREGRQAWLRLTYTHHTIPPSHYIPGQEEQAPDIWTDQYIDVCLLLVLQRTFIPVDCTALSGACDERHRRRGSAVASRPRGQAPSVCQRYAWARSRATVPAPAGWLPPALFFGSLVSPGVKNCYNINHLCLHVYVSQCWEERQTMRQTFEILLDIPDVTIEKVETERNGAMVITVKSTVEGTQCHTCGKKITKVYGDDREITLRHVPILGRKTFIRLRPVRYQCPYCDGNTTTQQFSWYTTRSSSTKAYEEHILLGFIGRYF